MKASFFALLVACALTAVSAHYHTVSVHKKPSCLSIAKKYCPEFAQTIVDQTPELSKFLNDSTSIVTLFCPVDAALPDAEIPDGTSIQDVLYYHVTDLAAYKAKSLVKASPINTILDQHALTVQKVHEYKKTHYYVQGDLTVALVTKADISCGAGVVHVIDTVLIPDLTKTSENYVPPCETSPPPVAVASPPCQWSWRAPNPPPVAVASPPCKWSWKASPPPVSVSSPPYCASPVTVSSPPPTCYSPPVTVSSPPPKCYSPVTVSSPPPACYSPPVTVSSPPPACYSPPVTVSSPPPACYSPPPVQVSSPPPACYSPPPVQVSSPPPACYSPPVTVSSPPPACYSPPPVQVSSPPPACYSPPPVQVSSPPPACYSPPPVQVSSPPPACYSPPPVQVSSPPPACYSPPPVQVSSPPPACYSPPPACSPPVTVSSPPPYCAPVASCPSIYAQISADANLASLKILIDIAGLQGALSDTTVTFTFFAPSNAALQSMGMAALCSNKDSLIATLKNHISPGVAVFKEQFSDGICLQTLYNKPVCASVTGSTVVVRAQGSSSCSTVITNYNVQACNSVIHTIDNVLVPSY